ncbi:hypothetical protein RSAG8_09977, partial [Rhizoctonia solani AG-8 WAC10335]
MTCYLMIYAAARPTRSHGAIFIQALLIIFEHKFKSILLYPAAEIEVRRATIGAGTRRQSAKLYLWISVSCLLSQEASNQTLQTTPPSLSLPPRSFKYTYQILLADFNCPKQDIQYPLPNMQKGAVCLPLNNTCHNIEYS